MSIPIISSSNRRPRWRVAQSWQQPSAHRLASAYASSRTESKGDTDRLFHCRKNSSPCTAALLLCVLALAILEPAHFVSAWWTGTTPPAQRAFSIYSSNSRSNNNQYAPEPAPFYPVPRKIDEGLLGDLTGGRPGAIIETEEQLATKEQMEQEMTTRDRAYSADTLRDYYGGSSPLSMFVDSDFSSEDDFDADGDNDLLDPTTLGTWTIQDIRARFPYEWDPLSGEPDPNVVQLNREDTRYVAETEKDADGVEVGYDPVFGPSNPRDTRTILGAIDSYMIDEKTRNDQMLSPQFPSPQDPEIAYNEEIVLFRKSLDILETYLDPFLPETMPLPRHVAPWYGYPEPVYLPPQNFTNNRFTDLDKMTDFDSMTPFDARKKAVELARSKNAEWLPPGVSYKWHQSQREPYERVLTRVGTLRPGPCDPDLVAQIQPALAILGSCCQLLSIEGGEHADDTTFATAGSSTGTATAMDKEKDSTGTLPSLSAQQTLGNGSGGGGTVYRFAYHGLMKNRHGMQCWTQTLLEDCGVTVTGVVLETGFRRRDQPYDGGDPWYAPLF